MFYALKETVNPKGGHGVGETFIWIIMLVVVIGVIILNILHTEIDPLLSTIATTLMYFIGYMVGLNRKEGWNGKERRTTQDEYSGRKDLGGEPDDE